jgi:DHA1 family bicyclomycin/chloramphenicol resistance-like MFS transporter
MVLVTLLPETLPVDARRPLAARSVGRSIRIVLTTPGIAWYLVSLTALFGAFMSYLASSELIVDQTFGLGEWFPAFFGGIALVMLCAMLLNSRLVERLGLTRCIRATFVCSLTVVGALFSVALISGGEPPFWLFVVLVAAMLFFHQMLIPNLNSAAMRPLAEVAGTGTAILNMVSGAVGAVIAEVINRQFDGTIVPFSIGFVAATVIAVTSWAMAERAHPSSDDVTWRSGGRIARS